MSQLENMSPTGRLLIRLHRQENPVVDPKVKRENEIRELGATIERGKRAKAILAGEFFSKDLVPFLEDRIVACERIVLESPAKQNTFEAIALDVALQRGQKNALMMVFTEIQEWVKAGEKAQNKLDLIMKETEKK